MKNKKGFTLIELLAVIVILAVIALIATPLIMGTITKAKRNAMKDTAYGILKAGEQYAGEKLLEANNDYPGETITLPNQDKINYKGGEGTSGELQISKEGNLAIQIHNNQFCAIKNFGEDEVTVSDYDAETCKLNGSSGGESNFGGTIVPATGEETHKGIVYLDSKDLTKECNEGNAVSTPGTKTGCMKWYIYDDEGDTYKMILDHNTTATVVWNSSNINTEMKEVKVALDTDTEGWVGSPRLITADEIAKITGNTSFNSATTPSSGWFYLDSNDQTKTANSSNKSKYAWLFDRTYNCTNYGCNIADNSNYGYWTSTAVSGSSSDVWRVYNSGDLYSYSASSSSYSGVRPVITVLKSNVS